MKKIFVVLATTLLFLKSLIAQEKLYSLEEVWQKTLQYYPSLASKKQLIQEQEFKKDLVKKQFLPDINVQAQHSYGLIQTIPGSFFSLPGMYTTNGSSKSTAEKGDGSNLNASAVFQWNILQFGRKQKRLAVADAAIGVNTQLLKLEEWQLLSTATSIYFDALNGRAALEIAQADTRRLSLLLELLQAQVSAGLRPGADTLLLKSSLLKSIAKEYEQRAVLRTQLIQLSTLIGERSGSFALDSSVYYRFGQRPIVAGEVLQSHPYLQVLDARLQQAEAENEATKKDMYPFVGLLAGVGLKGSGIQTDGSINKRFMGPWNNTSASYLVGVGITWNFSSLIQNKTKRAITETNIASAKAEQAAGKIQLRAQYEAALAGWEEQRQKVAAAKASMLFSREAYELYEVRYQSGLINLIELLQLQKNLQDAEHDYIAAVSSYWKELIQQSVTLGDLSLLLTAIQP